MDYASYNSFSHAFALSRDGMEWPEVEYFLTTYPGFFWQTSTVIDIWCWSGRIYWKLPECTYVWIDASTGLIEEAKRRYTNADFRVMEMQQILTRFPVRSFDVAILLASFHHLRTRSERIAVLRAIASVIRPNGSVFLTNWNLLSSENLKKYWRRRLENTNDFLIPFAWTDRYYHAFTPEELQWLFSESGFEIVENRIFVGERNIVSVLRLPNIV